MTQVNHGHAHLHLPLVVVGGGGGAPPPPPPPPPAPAHLLLALDKRARGLRGVKDGRIRILKVLGVSRPGGGGGHTVN